VATTSEVTTEEEGTHVLRGLSVLQRVVMGLAYAAAIASAATLGFTFVGGSSLWSLPVALICTLMLGYLLFDTFSQFAYSFLVSIGAWNPARRPRRRAPEPYPRLPETPRVAVLYCTADDFQARAVESLISLCYEPKTVFILDNGRRPEIQREIDAFVGSHDVTLIRRTEQSGGKSGNLNHALSQIARDYEVYAVFDSDSIARPDFIEHALVGLRDPHVAFVQGRLRSGSADDGGFATYLHPAMYPLYDGMMPAMHTVGMTACHGHGILVRTQAWRDMGEYPSTGGEDLALQLSARARGYYGAYAHDAICYDKVPSSPQQYVKREEKWARGAFCTFRLLGLPVLRSPWVDWREKIELVRVVGSFGSGSLTLALSLGLSILLSMNPHMLPQLRERRGFYLIGLVYLGGFAPALISHWRRPSALFTTVIWGCFLRFGAIVRNSLDVASGIFSGASLHATTGDDQDSGVSESRHARQSWWDGAKAADPITAMISGVAGAFVLLTAVEAQSLWILPFGLCIFGLEVILLRMWPVIGWLSGTISISAIPAAVGLIFALDVLSS